MEVTVTNFSFVNLVGGTGMSRGCFGPRYPHPAATVRVLDGSCDYETGWRFIGESADPQLTAFLQAHANAQDQRVFISEFHLADRRDLGPLVDFVEAPPTGH